LIDDALAIGTVASIPAAIDPDKGTGQVVIDTRMPPPSWRPGGFATARLVLQETKGEVVLPRDKVFYQENKAYCWSVDNSGDHPVAKRTWVTTGATDEKFILISKGLQSGDQIIVDGVAGLSDGVRIQVETASEDTAPKPADKEKSSTTNKPTTTP
jgi:multidrug efflux pump subunit AcrA (membrane-fusion protein)